MSEKIPNLLGTDEDYDEKDAEEKELASISYSSSEEESYSCGVKTELKLDPFDEIFKRVTPKYTYDDEEGMKITPPSLQKLAANFIYWRTFRRSATVKTMCSDHSNPKSETKDIYKYQQKVLPQKKVNFSERL